MRIVGLDIHRMFAEAVMLDDGVEKGFVAVRSLGRAQARGSLRLNMPVNRTALLGTRLSCSG